MLSHLKNLFEKLQSEIVYEHTEEVAMSIITGQPEIFLFTCWENGYGRRTISVQCESYKGTEYEAWYYTRFYHLCWHDWKNHRIETGEMISRLRSKADRIIII